MIPSRNTRSYTLRSVPSSPGRSFLWPTWPVHCTAYSIPCMIFYAETRICSKTVLDNVSLISIASVQARSSTSLSSHFLLSCWFVEGGVTDTGWRSRKILTGHELPAVLCDREESTLLLWPGNVLRAPGGRERRTEPRMPKHLQTITIIDDWPLTDHRATV